MIDVHAVSLIELVKMPSSSASKTFAETAGDNHGRTLIEVFENGTLMGAVLPEPSQTMSESTNASSVITLTSEMLNLNMFRTDSNSAIVNCSNNTSLSSGETCGALVIDPPSNMSSISGMLSQAEYLNSSDTCSSTLESNARRNLKRSSSRRKLKKCRPTEIFVNPFPPPYATIYVDAGSGDSSGQQNVTTMTGATIVPATAGFQNPIGSFASGHLTVQVPMIRR